MDSTRKNRSCNTLTDTLHGPKAVLFSTSTDEVRVRVPVAVFCRVTLSFALCMRACVDVGAIVEGLHRVRHALVPGADVMVADCPVQEYNEKQAEGGIHITRLIPYGTRSTASGEAPSQFSHRGNEGL